jgi:mediator of RNA polymerase II transcription subunit 14
MALNGSISYSSPILDLLDPTPNGFDEPPETELPVVDDGQVQLRDLVSRVVQACYAEMTEMAETWVTPCIQLIGSLFAWQPFLSS